ncbi:MAG: class I SAM-dependent methyltransferase [Acidobacteria bacterium]|nr:class I SAM-dependent methyltransferase [Acidobacteriota bacterium]
MIPSVAAASPDRSASGLLDHPPDPLRYDGQPCEPDEVVGAILQLIAPATRVLDVGCGTGSVSEQVVKATGAELVGLEPDPQRAEKARLRGLRVVEGELDPGLAAELGRFDAVLLADVLEHLSSPQELLLRAREFLGPNGAVVLSVPNVAHWTVRWDLVRGRWSYQSCGILDATHLRWFTRRSLVEFLARTGLQVVAARNTVGKDLSAYYERVPWRWMSRRVRGAVLRRLVRWAPDLFTCQFVLKARFSPDSRPGE